MMPGKSRVSFVASLVLFIAATPALADEIQLTLSTMFGSYSKPSVENPVYMATDPGSSQLNVLCCAQSNDGDSQFFFGFPAFSLPAGDKIFSAKLTLLFPSELQYSYEPDITQIFPPPDPNQSSVPGHILATVKTTTFASLGGCYFPASVTGFDFLTCNPEWDNLVFYGDSTTWIYPSVISTGFNSAESFVVEGGNHGTISGDLDIVYGVTPEPGSLILLGTAMVLTVVMKRRLVH